jgi:hypothetical protein
MDTKSWTGTGRGTQSFKTDSTRFKEKVEFPEPSCIGIKQRMPMNFKEETPEIYNLENTAKKSLFRKVTDSRNKHSEMTTVTPRFAVLGSYAQHDARCPTSKFPFKKDKETGSTTVGPGHYQGAKGREMHEIIPTISHFSKTEEPRMGVKFGGTSGPARGNSDHMGLLRRGTDDQDPRYDQVYTKTPETGQSVAIGDYDHWNPPTYRSAYMPDPAGSETVRFQSKLFPEKALSQGTPPNSPRTHIGSAYTTNTSYPGPGSYSPASATTAPSSPQVYFAVPLI